MKYELLKEAVATHETPLYIYDETAFTKRFQYMRKEIGPRMELTYSMKANPYLTKIASTMASRIEVCSYGEFLITRELGIAPEKLLISGVLKRHDDIMDIVSYGRDEALYTAESAHQYELLEEAGKRYGLVLPVLLRLSSGNQFGMDQDTILKLVLNRDEMKHVHIVGLHYFSGTQKKNLKKIEKELTKLDLFLAEIYERCDYTMSMLEYGTGFGVPYFMDQEEGVTAPESMAEFRSLVDHMDFTGDITVEMGRALTFNAGTYITTILDQKTTGKSHYCILDGGMHQINYDGQMKGMYVPHIQVISGNVDHVETSLDATSDEADDENLTSYTLCGSLCTGNDVLVGNFKAKKLSIGDALAFERTGAYSLHEGMSNFLSHELPEILFYNEETGFRSVRERRESYPFNMAK